MYEQPSMVQVLCGVVTVCKLALIRNIVDTEQVRGRKKGASFNLAGIEDTNLYFAAALMVFSYRVLESENERVGP